jgi:hypothetical protein
LYFIKRRIYNKSYNNKITIIGLTGYKRSGKDTIGNYLVNNYNFTRIAFADTLKEACKIIFGFTDEQVYGDDLKEINDEYWQHTPRDILQKVGSELFRNRLPEICNNISDDIWIRSVEKKILDLVENGHTKFIITDIRYQNEIDFIKKLNGVLWKVKRPVNLHNDTHESESNIDKFIGDYEFINDSTRKKLFKSVDCSIQLILK